MMDWGTSLGDEPLKSDLTPESKSTSTPSRSQNTLYLKVASLASLRSSPLAPSELSFVEPIRNPVSDCCCLAFFLVATGSGRSLAEGKGSPPLFDMLFVADDNDNAAGGTRALTKKAAAARVLLLQDDDREERATTTEIVESLVGIIIF